MQSLTAKFFAAAGLSVLMSASVTAYAASAEVRAKKPIGVALSLSGTTGVGNGLGLNAHYNINKRVQFGVGVASSSWDGTESFEERQKEKYKNDGSANGGYKAEEAQYSASVVAAETKIFLGNSFNLSGALGSRSVRGKVVLNSDQDSSGNRESTYTANGIVTKFAIGNDFTFDNGFVLGVEWLGIAGGASNKSDFKNSDDQSESAALTASRADIKTFSDERMSAISLYLLGARIGWAF